MDNLSETYSDLKEVSKSKRHRNRIQSAGLLKEAGIPFTSHNNDAHLIVEGKDEFIDFWPGTGRWKTRSGKAGFGVRNLIKEITKGD